MVVHVHWAVVRGEALAEELLAVLTSVPRVLVSSANGADIKGAGASRVKHWFVT